MHSMCFNAMASPPANCVTRGALFHGHAKYWRRWDMQTVPPSPIDMLWPLEHTWETIDGVTDMSTICILKALAYGAS